MVRVVTRMRSVRRFIRDWYITLREQANRDRRRTLRGPLDPKDFAEAERPGLDRAA